jgi:hypothetical protein
MTDEQITDWWRSENGLEDMDMCKIQDFHDVVRAVEAKIAALAAPRSGGEHG